MTAMSQSLIGIPRLTCQRWGKHIYHDEKRNPIDFGSRGQRSRSTLALFVLYLVDTIATTVFAQSLSNFTCKLWMIGGGTLLILGHGVKGQGQLWHSIYKTL